MNTIDEGILRDIMFNIMNVSPKLTIVSLKNVNKLFYKVSNNFNNNIDVLCECIVCGYLDLYRYFKVNAASSENTLYAMIEFSHFDLLKDCNINKKFYDDTALTYAIYSNNIKMVRYITNKLEKRFQSAHYVYSIVAYMDNVDIYTYINKHARIDTQHLVQLLIEHNSVNIIELLRFIQKNRKMFERAIIQISNQLGNQYMIHYCIENDYGNH